VDARPVQGAPIARRAPPGLRCTLSTGRLLLAHSLATRAAQIEHAMRNCPMMGQGAAVPLTCNLTCAARANRCVLRGCVPKKLMVYASEFADHFHDSKGFGCVWMGWCGGAGRVRHVGCQGCTLVDGNLHARASIRALALWCPGTLVLGGALRVQQQVPFVVKLACHDAERFHPTQPRALVLPSCPSHTHSHTYTHAHVRTHAHTHTRTHTHTHTYAHTHTHIRTRTHAHTHAYTHTYAHTHLAAGGPPPRPSSTTGRTC